MVASAIAPITGRFRTRLTRDLVGSISLGTVMAYYYWHKVHVPSMAKFRAHDAAVKVQVDAENAAFLAAQAQVAEEQVAVTEDAQKE